MDNSYKVQRKEKDEPIEKNQDDIYRSDIFIDKNINDQSKKSKSDNETMITYEKEDPLMSNVKFVLNITVLIISTLMCGFLSSWGFIAPYQVSYLRIYDKSIQISTANIGINLFFVGICLAAFFSVSLINRFGYKNTLSMSILLLSLINMFLAITKNIYMVVFLIFLIGIYYELILITSIFLIMKWIPGNPGISTFFGTLGMSFTPFMTGVLIQMIVNPNNVKAGIDVYEGKKPVSYHDENIAINVPYFFYLCSAYNLVVSIQCYYWFVEPKNDTTKNENNEKKMPLIELKNQEDSNFLF